MHAIATDDDASALALCTCARARLSTTHTAVTRMQVRALMFEPRGSRTYLQIDGEVIPAGRLFLEVHAGLLAMLVSPAASTTA